MPKRPQKRTQKLRAPLTRPTLRRSSSWILLAPSLILVACLYVNLWFRNRSQQHSSIGSTPLQSSSISKPLTGSDWSWNTGTKGNQASASRQILTGQDRKLHHNVAQPTPEASTKDRTVVAIYSVPQCKGNPDQVATAKTSIPVEVTPSSFPKSIRVEGNGLAEVHIGNPFSYKGTAMEVEGCVDFYHLFKDDKPQAKLILYNGVNTDKVLTQKRQIQNHLQEEFATTNDLARPHTRIVFSATSSQYFGYQVYANALGFLQSNQTNASWLRLLSSGTQDDLSEQFPTFTAPKSLYNLFYQPINKADVIDKWFHSKDAPHPDDTIVVIDPDNWLINDVYKWTSQVSPKKALAQQAYYHWGDSLKNLWKDLCLTNCDLKVDPAAVPYVIKAADLKEVAPLWRSYSIEIKQRFIDNTTFKEYYGPRLGVRWAAEMFGWNFACTHLGIKTQIVTDMQLRDVDGGKRQWKRLSKSMPLIHVGRAWFPSNRVNEAAPWRHKLSNEPQSVAANGIQVWCKCNGTAAKIQPWPLPEGLDFVSYHTLRLLHESLEHFGPIPHNETFRRTKPVFYAWSVP